MSSEPMSSDPEPKWRRPRASGQPIGTPEAPVGVVIIPPPPGASTVARCKTCPQTPPQVLTPAAKNAL